jgi:ATP-dependent helicase/nuclease subunit A
MMLHPIVEQMSLSTEQEPAVLERGRDVVVTAGAGTGKTRTLVARYLALLADGLPLRSVVAITFTRKAAREMRNRVRAEARKYLERDDLSAQERQRWQVLYSELDAARIGTIHSLCSEVLRRHPAEAQVDPRFDVLEEGQTNILRGWAVDEALAWAADDEQAVTLFALLGERELRRTLDVLVQRRLDVEEALARLPQDVLGHWRLALAERQEQVLNGLLGASGWLEAVATLQDSCALKTDDRMEMQRRAALEAVEGATGPLGDKLASLGRLSEVKLSAGSAKAWPGGKAQFDEVKTALGSLRDLWKSQSQLLELTLTPQDETLARALPALKALFSFACQRYDAFRRERNALDFDDLEYGALQLLEKNASVLKHWQEEVHAILVDEFQDTNGRQRDLVNLLNGGLARLFVVGDAKQSIYRFRGADVTVFRAERERIKGEGGAVLEIDKCYRAHRDLVKGLNNLLRPVLGEEADSHRPWAEPFAALLHDREAPGPGFVPAHVELHLTVGSKAGGALDRAADALAARLVELVEGGDVQIEVDGQLVRLDYGHTAILCRASLSFAAYEDALERAGVPFLTVAGRGFYTRPEVRDLLNALQALADPTDDLALAGLLRSPALALSDAALYDLCELRRRENQAVSLWEVLLGPVDGLRGDDRLSARRAVGIISELHDRVGRASVADVIKAFLEATDYRAALIQAGQSRGARNVAKLLSDAHTSGIVGVGEFVEYVNGLRDTGTREGEARATAEGVVQILTVHAAKGLEFPVVVIGDVTGGRGGGGSVLVNPDLGVLLPLKDEEKERPAMYRLGKERSDDQEDAEGDRLLYVAATRAREKLILSGCIGLKGDGFPSKLGGWLGKLNCPQGLTLDSTCIDYDEEGSGAHRWDLQVGETPVACTIYEPGYTWDHPPRETAPEARQPHRLPPPLLEPVAALEEQVDGRTKEGDQRPPRRVWRVVPAVRRPQAPAWVVGSLVHEALAAWRFPPNGFEAWVQARARQHGIADPRQLKDAAHHTRQLLSRFQAHTLCDEMDGADRRLHEVPYSRVVDGRVENGIIDALYLRDGSWTIVEFKSDEVRDEAALERLLAEENYLAQAQRYVAAVEHLLGERPRSVLCLLNYAGGVHLLHPLEGAQGEGSPTM